MHTRALMLIFFRSLHYLLLILVVACMSIPCRDDMTPACQLLVARLSAVCRTNCRQLYISLYNKNLQLGLNHWIVGKNCHQTEIVLYCA